MLSSTIMNRKNHIKNTFFKCLLTCILFGIFGLATDSYAQYEVVVTEEADQATIDGGAIQEVDGFTYYEMQNSGYLEWSFEIAAEGTYDLFLGTRLSSGTKGQHISINGNRFKNQAFPGNEGFVFDSNVLGMDWTDYRISPDSILESTEMNFAGPEILTLEAGSHTLRVESLEGFQHFSGFSLVDPLSGDTVATGTAPDALAEEVIPVCEESIFCPTGFKSVFLREGAFLTFNIFFPENGSYRAHIFFNAPNGGFSDLLYDWNAVAEDINYTPEEGDILTGPFEGEVGNRSLTIDTERGGFNVDYVQLIKESTSTANEQGLFEEEFSLYQNYPNPFSPVTTISYTLGTPTFIQLTVFDVLGRAVHVLTNTHQTAGTYQVTWDGLDANGNQVASGLYFYRMETERGIKTRRMIYLPE